MSIYSIRAVGADGAQATQTAQQAANQVDVQAFSRLLRQQQASLAPVDARTGATASSQVDVASATAQSAFSGLHRIMIGASGHTGNIVNVAGAAHGSGRGTWTGQVDTADGMIEKAAPYMSIIEEASATFGVPCNVIMGVIKAESDYRPDCVSSSGAKGLMQIMPCNEEYYGVTDPYDVRQNIFCGTNEISDLLNRYGGDLRLALAAYNTGPTRVSRLGVTSSSDASYLNVPESVRAYADRVLRYAGLSA